MSKSRLALFAVILFIASCAKQEPAPNTSSAEATIDTSSASTAASMTTGGPSPSPTLGPNHFKFWKVRPVPAGVAVSLTGQFDKETWWDARLRTVEYLGNPVDKNHEGIRDEKLHLVAYSLQAKAQPLRTVGFVNQFTKEEPNGIANWRLGQPALLLVPADKKLEGEPEKPPKADHFVCYEVLEPVKPFPRPLTLLDQFDRRQKKIEEIRELKPAYFCVPVRKRYKDQNEPILDPQNHLAVYRINPPEKFSITAMTWDQFDRRKLEVLNSELLAVPSLKRNWNEAKK